MIKLIPFELGKILRKRSFAALIFLLVLLNVFLLWYFNDPDESEPPLSAYKSISRDLSGMSFSEQIEYLNGLSEELENLRIIEDISVLRSMNTEYSNQTADYLMERDHELYEKYKDIYADGSFLKYTASIGQEKALIDEIFAECGSVTSYDDYIRSIEDNKNILGGVSIFHKNDSDSFSSRNIEKSFYDHEGLNAENIRFAPSKGVKLASQSLVTDLLLILAVFLFVGGLISEEKEKGLFYVTRATRNGVAKCIGAKLAALLIYCFGVTALMFASNFMYAELTTGTCDFTASLQSVSIFMESSLNITLGEYFLFGYLIKSFVLFSFGAALAAVCVISSRGFVMPLCGVGFLALNWLAYVFIPAYSKFAPIKYLSFWGIIDPKHLLGEYLNFNISERPVNRLDLGIVLIAVCTAVSAAAVFMLFVKGRSLEIRKVRIAFSLPFFRHGNLLLHEAHKILITNRAAAVLLIFLLLIGYGDLGRRYSLPVGEEYYLNFMTEVEGKLTPESEEKILAEQQRYEYAFEQIEIIEQMISSGELDQMTGNDMKSAWQSQTMFYPYFQRVEKQYYHVKEHGGELIYETGYSYLFGKRGDSFLIDFLLLTMCAVFAFSGVMPMEERYKAWNLLSATEKGKRRIISSKALVCAVCVTVTAVLPWIFRTTAVLRTYPLRIAEGSAGSLPMYYESAVVLPIWAFSALMILSQIIAVMIVAGAVMLISYKLKNNIQALFAGLAIFAVPLVLSVMGIDFAKWFSLYPIYSLSFI